MWPNVTQRHKNDSEVNAKISSHIISLSHIHEFTAVVSIVLTSINRRVFCACDVLNVTDNYFLHNIINTSLPSVLWCCWLGIRKGIWPIKTEGWGAGMVICLEWGADLHMAQLMPLPLTVSCFSKIQTGFTFLVAAHPGSPGQRAVKWVCVYIIRWSLPIRSINCYWKTPSHSDQRKINKLQIKSGSCKKTHHSWLYRLNILVNILWIYCEWDELPWMFCSDAHDLTAYQFADVEQLRQACHTLFTHHEFEAMKTDSYNTLHTHYTLSRETRWTTRHGVS